MDELTRKQIQKMVAQRNLCSYMNDTKWKELHKAIVDYMPFHPPYIMKTLFEDCCNDEQNFQKDVYYVGDWVEAMPTSCYASIEWIKVRPRYLKARGRLVEPECIDASKIFEEILIYYHIPFEKENGMYCIYGYK